MTREIKFRAYNPEEEMMYNNWTAIDQVPENWELMQYTGLTCNGHDWYEGDILENDSDWYQITWDTEQARWEATGIRSTCESLALSELLSQETWVQGNIYSNPNLLHENE